MPALTNSNPLPRFATFHGRTEALPIELTTTIIELAYRPITSLLGHRNAGHAPIATVSSTLRNIYLEQPSNFDFGVKRCRRPFKQPTLRETLNFPDLWSLARFFTHGPGRIGYDLSHVTYVRVVYVDYRDTLPWDFSLRYAYEAFELLVANLGRMRLQRLQLCLLQRTTDSFNADTPGVWSLLKVRDLEKLILTSCNDVVDPRLRKALKSRVRWSAAQPWRPLGFENPGPGDWQTRVRQNGLDLEQYLNYRYPYLHDRLTVDARAQERRKVHDRRYGQRPLARLRRSRVQRRRNLWKKKALARPKEDSR
jgi:hypothetical protein